MINTRTLTPPHIQQALENSESKFKHLTELMPMGIFSTDHTGIITYYNNKASEMWGRSPRINDATEMLYCGSWKLIYPDGTVMPHNQCPMAKSLMQQRKFRNEEICVERPDGERRNVLVNIDPLFDDGGKLLGAINIMHDITDYKKTKKEINRLAAIVECTDDAIIGKNLDGVITTWNRGAQSIFGYTEEEAVGQHITLIIPDELRSDEQFIINQIKSGKKVEHYETIRMRKDGTRINISLTVSPIKDSNGNIIGASKISRDITERVRMDNELKEYTEKLKELNKYKDQFMAIASHELKTPLTVIKANLQVLEMLLEKDANKAFVEKTMKQVNKLSDLITDLLDVSKIQAGNLSLNITRFDLVTLIKEVIDNLQSTSSTHKITQSNDTEPIMIRADRTRIEQVIVNMLTNGIKYSPGGESILVGVKQNKGEVRVSVQDFGIGIPKEDQKKIFSRFFRVDGISLTFSGSGIGLYISEQIMKRHNGKMWVESELGRGSTFYFSLEADR